MCQKEEMGTYLSFSSRQAVQEEPPSAFVEPVAYGFEEEESTKFIIVGRTERKRVIEACNSCVDRTKKLIRIENSSLCRYQNALEDQKWSLKRSEMASEELDAANINLQVCKEKNSKYVSDNDKAPLSVRQALKLAYCRKRAALEKMSHASARVARKETALTNLMNLYQSARERTRRAVSKQIACSSRGKIWAQ